jgi:D-alanyl-D-alanine carboxypeptidase/D-alanyl-D-alanine-endopeptidase (penicillin-binding protein 4)
MYILRIFIICLIPFAAFADIPLEYKKIIQKYKAPPNTFTFVVKNITDKSEPLVAHNEKLFFNPASLAKVISTFIAIERLGPQFKWNSDFFHNGDIVDDVLYGDLIFKGRGDATFSIVNLEDSIRKIQRNGIKKIKGNLILDLSYFGMTSKEKLFDNDPMRAYNVLPHPVVIQSNTMNFIFSVKDSNLKINSNPDLSHFDIKSNVKITNNRCIDWKSKLNYRTEKKAFKTKIIFGGKFSRKCGVKEIDLSALESNEYFYRIFKETWNANGGEFDGNLDATYIQDSNWKFLYRHTSRPLSEVVRDMNKYSLNLMARNTMLTILAENTDLLVLESSVNEFVHAWFEKNKLPHQGLVFENGAGLSRNSVLTSEQLLLFMEKIYHDPLMPEMLASFPISGVDGTLKRRMNYSSFKKSAHFKTGSMKNVNAIAGFLLDKNKEMKIFIFIMNDIKAKDSQAFQEALIAEAFK